MSEMSKEECLARLRAVNARLAADGAERYPCRSDFTDAEVAAIKARLGPWPRALEAAGIKPPRDEDRKAKNLEKRIRAKRARRGNLDKRLHTVEKTTEQK